VGMVFNAFLGEFLLEFIRTGRKVQQIFEGMEIKVLISTRSYKCMECDRIFLVAICGTNCVCNDSLGC
jgi:hypothetical protein